MGEFDNFFSNRELYVIDQPDARELSSFCCVVSGGKLWANDSYITDRYGYARMLFVYVESGAMNLEYEGHKHVVESGQAFFIDCDMHHVYGTHGDSCVLTFIHFMGGPSDYFFRNITAKSGYVFAGYGAKLIKNCIIDVVAVTKSHMQNKPGRFCEILSRTLFGLLTHESENDPLLEQAAIIIRESVASNSSLAIEEVAKKIGYSKYYFTRKFTEAMGVPPYEFVLREKMALAKKMLINTSLPVGEIALACGFFDASHMSNCFKKREGLTPLEFRHDWKATI